jgi:serine protease Do
MPVTLKLAFLLTALTPAALTPAAFGLSIVIGTPAWAQQAQPAQPDMGGMLRDANKYTVKVRSTVAWPFAPEQFGTSQGTGFLIDKERGWIITNAHVAKRSPSTVEIAIGDAEADWIPVTKVYVDNHLDIAVLKVAIDRLPEGTVAAKLGCDQEVKQGSAVVAYGHPISLNFTATRGIVSSVRTLGYQEFVQMDASINPGNSGGPLLALDAGQVIGVNTANFPGAPGLGLATSIRHVCPIVEQLVKNLDPTVPTLPVYWMKQGRAETLTVAASFPNSPFPSSPVPNTNEGVGLKNGDVVVSLKGGAKIAALPDLYTALRGQKQSITLIVQRDGKETEVRTPLIDTPAVLRRQAVTVGGLLIAERQFLDTEASTLPPLRVEFVKQGETASRAGFVPGDQIATIGGQSFTKVADLHTWLQARPANEKIRILVRRSVFSNERRITAEYHRFEVEAKDVALVKAGE